MAKVGDSVVQMMAADDDSEGSGATTYEIVSGNELGKKSPIHDPKLQFLCFNARQDYFISYTVNYFILK